MTKPIDPNQLRISVEMGSDYQPSDRLATALGELAAALNASESEVEGFKLGTSGIQDFRIITFDSALTNGLRQGSADDLNVGRGVQGDRLGFIADAGGETAVHP